MITIFVQFILKVHAMAMIWLWLGRKRPGDSFLSDFNEMDGWMLRYEEETGD